MRTTRPNDSAASRTQPPTASQQRASRLAFVGSFTTQHRGARGKGITAYDIGTDAAGWRQRFRLEGPVNPSFQIADPQRHVLYCAHGDERHVSAYSVDPQTGTLELVNHAAAGGLNGVHLALDPTGRFLIVANHDSGSLGVLPVARDGSLGDAVQIFDMPGSLGPRREQFSAQPHQAVFDPSAQFVIVPAKGTDRVFVFGWDAARGQLSLHDESAIMRPGAGPRHAAFHPRAPFLFVVNEIESSVAVCGWNERNGVLAPLNMVSCLPDGATLANTASAIVTTRDGRHVYVSNRGHDSIAHFAFDEGSARLTSVAWVSANGECPRFMTLHPDTDVLLVAAEQGGRISAFSIAPETGRLLLAGAVADTASPSAIAFL